MKDDVHRTLTFVDITNPARPNIVKQLSLPVGLVSPGVEAMVGNVALLEDGGQTQTIAPRTFTIVDFSDPAHAAVQRKFENVASMKTLPGSLICLTDPTGLWILKQEAAHDEQLEAAYGNYVLYGLH